MSKLTEILNLFCYDPETDGANTFNIPKALNENWEKIDQLVLLAVAAAAAYDPGGSYAVGDYCTHAGKLHKCNTPIPSGETWNEEHWTATTVAAELSKKVDVVEDICADLNDFLSVGRYVKVDESTGNLPDPSIDFGRAYNIGLSDTALVQIVYSRYGNIYARGFAAWEEPKFRKWTIVANAIPPQEHAIVPKNGATFIDGYKNSYSKDQFGRVVVVFSLHFESVPESSIEIFSLPQSFAPTGGTVVGAAVLSMSVYFPALVTAYTNGMVTVGHNVTGYSGPINLHGFLVIDTGGTK